MFETRLPPFLLCLLSLFAQGRDARPRGGGPAGKPGDTEGGAPARREIPPEELMDYGPFLMGTIGSPSVGDRNRALKGIAVPLGSGGRAAGALGGVVFDSELLRPAFGWRGGFLNLRGTAYDGSHGTHPGAKGVEWFSTRQAPGRGRNGDWRDPRPIPYGPLPEDRYLGLYLHGRQVILSYRIEGRRILERYRSIGSGEGFVIRRDLEIAPGGESLELRVFDGKGRRRETGERLVLHRVEREAPGFVAFGPALFEGAPGIFGPPSREDYADAHSGNGVTMRFVEGEGLAAPHPRAGAKGRLLPRLQDGEAAKNDDDTARCVWFDGDRARIHIDLRKEVEVHRLQAYSWHRSDRAPQRYVLFGTLAAEPDAAAKDLEKAGWTRIAAVDTTSLGQGGRQVSSLGGYRGGLGRFRHLLLDCERPLGSGTFFHEIDVWAGGRRPPVDALEFPRVEFRAAALKGEGGRLAETEEQGGVRYELRVPPSRTPVLLSLLYWRGRREGLPLFERVRSEAAPPSSLEALTRGGPARWEPSLVTRGRLGRGRGAYVVDTVGIPEENPWRSRMRLAAFDFFPGGTRAAVSTWNGDVWTVEGLDEDLDECRWKRFATGLFDPLGLKIVDGVVHVLGRDGITRLHDLDGDGEADFYECFNNEVLITKAFHEFAFDLQTDDEGNFYFAKAGPVRAGGRGFEKILPHHGCLLKVPKDGKGIEVFATGLRAPNGISIAPKGAMGTTGVVATSGDNEGTWMPQCRLNWITKGTFCGVPDTSHRDPRPKTYDDPICFIPWPQDNSGGGQVWVPDGRFGPFEGDLLHLSYGTCSLFKAMVQRDGDRVQGGVVRFPLSFASGIMRARFNERSGQLWVVGLKGWQTSAARIGCLQRVRYTGKPVHMPRRLFIGTHGIALTFTCELDPETAEDPESFSVKRWNYLWTSNYGSPEVSVAHPDRKASTKGGKDRYRSRDPMPVKSARLSKDRKTVWLELDDLKRVMQMEIRYNLDAKDGALLKDRVWLTVNWLGADPPEFASGGGGGR